jgi:hypothetical protein
MFPDNSEETAAVVTHAAEIPTNPTACLIDFSARETAPPSTPQPVRFSVSQCQRAARVRADSESNIPHRIRQRKP